MRNTQGLKKTAEQAENPFDEMDKREVKRLVTWVHEQDYTDEFEFSLYTIPVSAAVSVVSRAGFNSSV